MMMLVSISAALRHFRISRRMVGEARAGAALGDAGDALARDRGRVGVPRQCDDRPADRAGDAGRHPTARNPAYPFLFAEVFASNIGGTATLIGDPPNIIIGSAANLSFNDFVIHLTPVIVIVMAAQLVLTHLIWGAQLWASAEARARVMALDEREHDHRPAADAHLAGRPRRRHRRFCLRPAAAPRARHDRAVRRRGPDAVPQLSSTTAKWNSRRSR